MGSQSQEQDSDSRQFTLAILMQHAGKLLADRMREGFERIDLPPAQGQVLHLLEWEDGVGQRKLAELMRISAPTMTGILNRMEATGLIQRRDDPDDERAARVFLTRKGRRKSDAARAAVAEVEQELIAGLTQSQLRNAHALLRQLRNNLGGAPPGSEPSVSTLIPKEK